MNLKRPGVSIGKLSKTFYHLIYQIDFPLPKNHRIPKSLSKKYQSPPPSKTTSKKNISHTK
jgi:hypothetical protein